MSAGNANIWRFAAWRAARLIFMILIKARGRAKNFTNWKTRLKFEGNGYALPVSADDRLSCVFLRVQRHRVYHAKSAAACGVTAVTRRTKFYPGSLKGGREGGNLRKMPDIEDVRQRDASHSIIISLLAFPKGLYQALPRIQSNAIGD